MRTQHSFTALLIRFVLAAEEIYAKEHKLNGIKWNQNKTMTITIQTKVEGKVLSVRINTELRAASANAHHEQARSREWDVKLTELPNGIEK